MFIRTESFRQFLRHYPVTSAILAIDTLIFLFFFIAGKVAPFLALNAFQFLVGSNQAIWNGALWQLATPIFLHVTFQHFLFNAFSILIFAPALEAMLGKGRYLLAFLGTGIIANIAELFLQPAGFSHYGASAAVFGLFGIYLFLIVFRRAWVTSQDQTILIVTLALALVFSFIGTGIDIVGHLTGLLSGLALGPLLFSGKKFQR
ncbi:rhomboid family intramembrane serine protease [Sporolactobacillus vineae]|uniref:rhomboid family intramembrane serine protease n=1 Tax=Sporolactobacillus vineae TaxID=444463 RepID=UPI000287E168|nr:rhomboid family intramembrane serine protease [Sporolactobacillus vineae]